MPDARPAPAWTRDSTVRINADAPTVCALLQDVRRWPLIFDHIQSVRVVKQAGPRRLIVVRASWFGIPVGWRAIQTVEPEIGRMTLQHVSPLTRGSVAVWEVRRAAEPPTGRSPTVELLVHSRVIVPLPLIGPFLARYVVGGRVARGFGQAMAERIKQIAECRCAPAILAPETTRNG